MKENNIGVKLSDRRAELSLTQRQVADYVGVTEATVSRWESGKIDNMRRDKIARLANVLRVSPLLIMGIGETPKRNDAPAALPEGESRLLEGFRGLTAAGKQTLLAVLDSLRVSHAQ